MSKTIDQKVVQMQFDNQNFEKNAQQTMSTLDKLKAALKFDGANKGADDLARGIKNVNTDFSQCEITATRAGFHIQDVLLKISTVLEYKIARQIVNIGENLARSLTIDQVKAGWEEYGLKMGSIQTIMASTGEKLEVVNKYLEDLNHYSDKTIYSFSDMTTNIGKFTNAGVKLKDAVAAIQGVANVAAVSGANANEASRAMYNFAQALSSGYVKLIDWKSIENANMATVEFKDTLLQTAVAMKKAESTGDGMYKVLTKNAQGKTMDGAISATKNFNDSLAYQWMTTDVLTQALEIYSQDIREMSDEERKAYEDKLKLNGFTQEQIEKFEQLGIKAADAATEVKTFSQLMDTIKESIGSGWATSFEHIIGNFEEAKALFTDINKVADRVIGEIDDRRNTLLNNWKMRGGREYVIQGFTNIAKAIGEVIKVAKDLWYFLFPPTSSKNLALASKRFEIFTRSLIMNKETAEKLKETLQYLLVPVKVLIEVIKVGAKLIVPLFTALQPLLKILISFVNYIAKVAFTITKAAIESETFRKILSSIKTIIKTVVSSIKNLVVTIGTSLINALQDSNSWLRRFIDALVFLGKISLGALMAALNAIANFKFSDVTAGIEKMRAKFKEFTDGLKESAKNNKVFQVLLDVINKLKSGFEFLKEAFLAFSTTFKEGLENVHSFTDFLKLVKSAAENAFKPIIDFLKDKFLGENGNIFDKLKDSFMGFIDVLKEGMSNIPWAKVILIAFCLGLAAAVLQLVSAITKFGYLASALSESFRIVNDAIKRFTGIRNRLVEIKEISWLIGTITASLVALSMIPKEDLYRATAVLASLAGGLLVLGEVMMFLNKKAVLKPGATSQLFISLASLAAGAAILTAAVYALRDLKTTISELLPYIGELGIIMAELIAAMTVLALLSKKLTFSLSAFSAISLIAFAGSVYLICQALKELSTVNINNVEDLTKVLISVLGGFAVISALSKKMGFWSFAAIVAIAVALKNLVPTIQELAWININDDARKMMENITKIITIVGIVSIATSAFSMLTKVLSPKKALFKRSTTLLGDFSRTLLAIGISISIMVLAITKLITTIDKLKNVNRLNKAVHTAGVIIVALGALMIIVSRGGKIFNTHKNGILKFAAAMALISLSIVPMILCVEELAKFVAKNPEAALGKATVALDSMLLFMGVLVLCTGVAKGVDYKLLLTLFGGLTLVVAEIIAMTMLFEGKFDIVAKSIGVLVATLISLDGALFWLSKMNFNVVKMGPIVAFTAAIAALFTGMIVAAALLDDNDVDRLGDLVLYFIGVISTVTVGLFGISKAALAISWSTLIGMAVLLATFVGSFVVIANTVEGIDWDGMEEAFWGFIGVMAVLGVMATVMADLPNTAETAVVLGALAASIVALAGACKLLEGLDPDKIGELLTQLGLLEGIFVALAAIIGGLDYAFGVGAVVQVAILVFAALNVSVGLLAAGVALLATAIDSHLVPAFIKLGENADIVSEGITKVSAAVSVGIQNISTGIARGIATISKGISVGIRTIILTVSVSLAQGFVTFGAIIVSGIGQIWEQAKQAIRSKIPFLKDYGKESGNSFDNGLKSTIGSILGTAASIIGQLLSTLGSYGGSFFGVGASLFGSLLQGFGSKSNSKEYTETVVESAKYGANTVLASGQVKTATLTQQKKAGSYQAEQAKNTKNYKTDLTLWKNAQDQKAQKSKEVNIAIAAEEDTLMGKLKAYTTNFTNGAGKDWTIFGYRVNDVFDAGKNALKDFGTNLTNIFDPSTWAAGLDFEDMMKNITDASGDAAEAMTGMGNAAEEAGGKAKKGAKSAKEASDEISSFVEKMEGSFNILDEFKLDEGDEENPLTGDKLISNMRSNVDGMVKWSHEMKSISDKVAQGLYKKLADMGPQGYKYVHAFAQMTAEQLAEVNQLYTTSLVIPTSVTAEIYQGMNLAAGNAYTGFANGLKIEEFQTLGINLATGFLTGLTDPAGLDTHSPSKKTYAIGTYATQGLSNGLKDMSAQEGLKYTISNMCREIIQKFRLGLSAENFKDIGQQVLRGLNNGILSKNPDVLKSVTNLCEGIEHKARTVLQINSPSKVFAEIGSGIPEGLSKGITDNLSMVESSTQKMAEATVDNMRDAIATIQTVAESDMDVEPVIRPVVDLSNVQNGGNLINSLLGPSFTSGVNVPQANFMQTSQLISNTDNSNVVDAVVALQDDVVSLKDAMTNIKMVLDTGTMVGAMTPAIDQELGARQVLAGRSI